MADKAAMNEGAAQETTQQTPTSVPPSLSDNGEVATALVVIGMAGSGKSTFVQRICTYLHQKQVPAYTVNLDPAVRNLGFGANVDIRDTVKYKQVMETYGLGPNGGIMTCMNLFATRFNQVMELVDKRATQVKYTVFDTPGQIEVFTWSASGSIMTESIAGTMPTAIVYVMDTMRCQDPVTFMSNMLYACSIMYKSRLPFIIVFNKIDIASHVEAQSWMADFENFQEALDGVQNDSYMNGLARSMSLVLDEFYQTISSVGVSSVTGQGMDDFFEKVTQARQEYMDEYVPELERMKGLRKEKERVRVAEQLEKFKEERAKDTAGGAPGSANPPRVPAVNKEAGLGMATDADEDDKDMFGNKTTEEGRGSGGLDDAEEERELELLRARVKAANLKD